MVTTPDVAATLATLQSLPIDQLSPNPWNRTVFGPDALKDLVASLKAVGIKEPLIVRPCTVDRAPSTNSTAEHGAQSTGYEIVSGHRRWLAAKEAGLKEAPCIVQAQTDEQVAEDNITINIQREDLPPLEAARMVQEYMDRFKKSQKEAADKFGKSLEWVKHLVGFLTIPGDVQEKCRALHLGWNHLQALKVASPDHQKQVAQELQEGKVKPEGVQKRCRQLKFAASGVPSPGLRHPLPKGRGPRPSPFREKVDGGRMRGKYGFGDSRAVLRIPDYRYFLLGRFAATLATQMQALIVSWQVYQLTKNPLALGLIGLVEAAVFFSFALWAGHFADRHEKKRIIIVTQVAMLACTGTLMAISCAPHVHVFWIYGVIGFTGLARSFMWPASFAYSELTVPRVIYSRAAAWRHR